MGNREKRLGLKENSGTRVRGSGFGSQRDALEGQNEDAAGARSCGFERRQRSITDLPLSGHMTHAGIKAFYQRVPYNVFLCEVSSSSG